MKIYKFFLSTIFLMVIVTIIALNAEANLQTIGTATYNSTDYNLIYDTDLNITWLDYTNAANSWDNQVSWASGLNTGGVLTYNFNSGVSMNWSGDWRLPTSLNQDGSGPCGGYNCTGSEMGHLYYSELGNSAGYGGFTNTGDFANLQTVDYWSGTEDTTRADWSWLFLASNGEQFSYYKYLDSDAIAVRSGQLAVVPEPISSTLFIVGGATLGFRQFRKKFKK